MKTENKLLVIISVFVILLMIVPTFWNYYESSLEKSVIESVAYRSMKFWYSTVPTTVIVGTALISMIVAMIKTDRKENIKEGSKP